MIWKPKNRDFESKKLDLESKDHDLDPKMLIWNQKNHDVPKMCCS